MAALVSPPLPASSPPLPSSSSSSPLPPSSSPPLSSSSTTDDLFSRLSSLHSSGPVVCPGHSRPVPFIDFSSNTPDGYFLISSCLDNKSMIRDGISGDWVGTFIGHKGAVWCSRLNNTATKAVTGSADFTAKLWDALTGDELYSFNHKHIVKSVVFSNNGTEIITAGQEKRVRIFDLGNLGSDPLISGDEGSHISHCITLPDSNLFATATSSSPNKSVKIWDKRTLKEAKLIECNGAISSINTSLDQSILVIAAGKEISIYNANTFSLLYSYTLPLSIDCIAYDPIYHRFATGSSSELWVHLYDAKTGNELAVHKGHHGPARSLAFAPHGLTFASGSEDGTIRIWATPNLSSTPASSSSSSS